MTTSDGFRMSLLQPNSRDAEFVKKRAFHDSGVLVVSVNDPRIGWVEKQLLQNLGEKLYGKPKT